MPLILYSLQSSRISLLPVCLVIATLASNSFHLVVEVMDSCLLELRENYAIFIHFSFS